MMEVVVEGQEIVLVKKIKRMKGKDKKNSKSSRRNEESRNKSIER